MRQSTKRFISLIGALLMFAGAFVVYFNFVSPAYREAQTIKSELLGQSNLLVSQEKIIAQVQSLIDTSGSSGPVRDAVNAALPSSRDEAEAINTINTLATVNRLAIQSLVVTAPALQSGARGQATSTAVVRPLGVLSLQVKLAGTYADFKAFLRALETNVRVMDLKTANVDLGGKANQDFYLFDIAITTYYQSN